MKIALFVYSLECGGAERVTSHLANAWAGMGREVTIITLTDTVSDAYTLDPAVRRIGLDIATESQGIIGAILINARRILILRRTLKKLDVDVVVAMMMIASILAVLAAVGLKCRTVISERCYPPAIPVGRLWSTLRRLVYPLADCMVAQTQETRDWLQAYAGCRKIAVIPNPVVLPLTVTTPILIPDLVLNPDRQLLLAVGRLCHEKGFDLLLEAFARVASQCKTWDLVILGEGELHNNLETQINNLGLATRVILPGRAGNMSDWYERAAIFVLSSRSEGFPNVLIEAMAYGCAVVSYDCHAGPRDIITHSVNGLLLKPVADIDALTKALWSLMSDEDKRKDMGRNAVVVQEKFSMAEILSLWEKVIVT
jgi:glycosyltransferase involved in cell wall biosynthesis